MVPVADQEKRKANQNWQFVFLETLPSDCKDSNRRGVTTSNDKAFQYSL
jgi:hypothetical protein